MKYVNVIVDNNTNATDSIFSYICEDDCVCVGQKVKIPFSVHNRITSGYVTEILDEKPEGIKQFKRVTELDPDIVLTQEAIRTAQWMHRRYLCRYIEAIKLFLPAAEVKGKTKDPFEKIELDESDAVPKTLNDEQQRAFEKINSSVESGKHSIYLLHGVTGGGKTEVYLQLMQSVIKRGKQGIMLVPEISLTPQIISRFMSRFGRESVAVIHSKITQTRRAEEYRKIASGEAKIVVGARSAVFAPFKNLGIIILDEEHENSYKSDKSPKYDTIEVAAKRAIDTDSVLVLGSATPSVSDYYRSREGIFNIVELSKRYNANPLPLVSIADMTKEAKAGNRNLFSGQLAEKMSDCLRKKKQIILFLNRRGYSGYISCRECGYTVKCSECGLVMPYHKDIGACVCHYCGRKARLPRQCPECSSRLIGGYGVGTQQVEEKTRELFPDAAVERLDLDSIKKKGELEAVLRRFGKGKTDILIGTQLVAKGLDFANVGLVGVVSADVTLNIPDFRASERTFQLVTQAAGRAGRGDEQGQVIIQTYTPDSPALIYAARHDYKGFYEMEIELRRACSYPPFSDIIQILIQDTDSEKASCEADAVARHLRSLAGDDTFVLGPSPSALIKQDGLFRFQILVKSPAGKRKETSEIVSEARKKHETIKNPSLFTVDINPFSYM